MSHIAELLPFVFLGIVIVVFLPTGKFSTPGGVRPLSLPSTGSSLRGQPQVADLGARFLYSISHLVAVLRDAIIGNDLYTTSRRNLVLGGVDSHIDPYNLLRSTAQAMGWSHINQIAVDILYTLEYVPDTQPLEPIYIQCYLTSFLLNLLSYPNAITPGVSADIVDGLVRGGVTLFDDEEQLFIGNNQIVANFIIATGNEISPVVIGLIHLARCDRVVAQVFRAFSSNPTSWDNYARHHIAASPSVQQIAHYIHCQTPVWLSDVSSGLSDDEIEFFAAFLAIAFFTFHDGSTYAIAK